jgi:O-antigen/teichoic acid export membrane protein
VRGLGWKFASLGLATVVQLAVGIVLAWLLPPEDFGLAWSRHSLCPQYGRPEARVLAGFGAGMSLTYVFNYFATQGDYFVVGRVLGLAPLGFYARACSLMTMPTNTFVQGPSSMLFPAASRVRDARFGSRAPTSTGRRRAPLGAARQRQRAELSRGATSRWVSYRA